LLLLCYYYKNITIILLQYFYYYYYYITIIFVYNIINYDSYYCITIISIFCICWLYAAETSLATAYTPWSDFSLGLRGMVGQHFVPRLGLAPLKDFQGLWPHLVRRLGITGMAIPAWDTSTHINPPCYDSSRSSWVIQKHNVVWLVPKPERRDGRSEISMTFHVEVGNQQLTRVYEPFTRH